MANPLYKAFTLRNMDDIEPLSRLPDAFRQQMRMVARVLPFRANSYVINELIDWDRIPDDPIFHLTFPQPGMLSEQNLSRLTRLARAGTDSPEHRNAVQRIRLGLNPHPAKQMELNVPMEAGRRLNGLQHKYRETVLVFPSQGQTCHAYCTYCFRWPQFCGMDRLRFECRDPRVLFRYLDVHPEITDVLLTGGDPLTMKTNVLRRYVEPLIARGSGLPQSIRFGTKALAYWPYRFLTDKDSDDLMRMFEDIVASGRSLAIMAHFSHPRELETSAVEKAMARLRSTGAVIRCQAPIVRHINDHAEIWADMWRRQVRLGAIPYYMFMARNTGANAYFKVPLARALRIFNDAYRQVSGLCRTVRGPSRSASPGKVLVNGIATIHGEPVFSLKFIQGRDPAWVNRLFFARHDPNASWIDELRPAFGEKLFFFETVLDRMTIGRMSNAGSRGIVKRECVA